MKFLKARYYDVVVAVAQICNEPKLPYCRLVNELSRRFPKQVFDYDALKQAWSDFNQASAQRIVYAKG